MKLGVYHGEPKVLQFKGDVSIGSLAEAITQGDATTLTTAKDYTDTKTENLSKSTHTHVVTDITDASTELATKTHTHVVTDITDSGMLLRVYSETPTVEMENDESFYYLNTTDKKIYLHAKANDTVTDTEVGALS